MPLVRLAEPFNAADWIFEIKYDGFRALAEIDRGACRLISRNGFEFKQWPALTRDVGQALRGRSAVLDGEIVCLDPDGRSDFSSVVFRRGQPFYCVFDALMLDGRDLRRRPLLERKALLFGALPRIESRVRYVDHIHEQGVEFFKLACARDLEGIVGKWERGTYLMTGGTSWVKVKNPSYTQLEGRADLFDSLTTHPASRRKTSSPALVLA
jgi:bifunctional non-homologous end joining protein LigD